MSKSHRLVLACLAALVVAALGTSKSQASIQLSPGSQLATTLVNSNLGSVTAIETAFSVNLLDTLSLVYKANFGGSDEGSFAGSYNTSFSVPDVDDGPSGGTILHLLNQPSINLSNLYLIVKDGRQTPAQYLFDISNWDGTESIELSGFWEGTRGAISNVAIWGGGTRVVPEATSVAVWTLLIGVAAFLSSRAK